MSYNNKKLPAENLGNVPLLNGARTGDIKHTIPDAAGGKAHLVRERDPQGAIVVHAIKKSQYVHERLHAQSGSKQLPNELFDAAEKFRRDFEMAQLGGHYARMDLLKTRAGPGQQSDTSMMAGYRVGRALGYLGTGRNGESLSQSCIWNVVGRGLSFEQWTGIVVSSGRSMNADKAAGIFHGALERLAFYYGMLDPRKIAAAHSNTAFLRGVEAVREFIAVFQATAAGPEKAAMIKLQTALAQRYDRKTT